MKLIVGLVVVALLGAPGCGTPPAPAAQPPATNTIVTMGDMVLVPSGTFAMGNCNESVCPLLRERIKAVVKRESQPKVLDNESNELPVHTVMVSAFYMDKHEVTKEKWDEVYNWAINNGYTFANTGSGKAANHPVWDVSWYDCVKWCNARSEKEGLTPCYYTDAAQTQICRIGQISLSSECVNWTTNGYRLPTEAEWEKAARGGVAGCRFPWGNTISHDQANYLSHASIRYDKSRTRGSHPRFADTGPVGSFDPNGYGLYDMVGNVWEWTWDWYDDAWYNNAGATQNDTRGPTSGTYHVLRGGGWVNLAYYARCAGRVNKVRGVSFNLNGFRCVRGL